MNNVADVPLEETERVRRHRYTTARQLGMSVREAAEFADSDGDLNEFRKLIEAGCPLQLARRIVL